MGNCCNKPQRVLTETELAQVLMGANMRLQMTQQKYEVGSPQVEIADCYANIGRCNMMGQKFDEATHYFNIAIQMLETCDPKNRNIKRIQNEMKQMEMLKIPINRNKTSTNTCNTISPI